VTTHRVVPMGPLAWLVEPHGTSPADYAAAVRARGDPAVIDVVPAAATVLVTLTTPDPAFAQWLTTLRAPVREREEDRGVEVPVVYDGADLAHVAATTGMTTEEVVRRHTAAVYTCAFCGFAPGFGYLEGLDPALHLPRRSTPRTSVPAGSVAIAAGYAAVYPSASPGGWHLLGRTDLALWRTDREQPALITPGTRVQFVAVGP
jgi:KipI family sensor histidine kinase inhibitor